MPTSIATTALRIPSNLLASLLLCLPMLSAQAASSLLIWPLAPVVEADQRASSMWLENLGQAPVTLQIRVLAWSQDEARDQYQQQQHLIASPPFANIEPGARQLVRLTATTAAPPGTEQAYRILIDEIPVQPADAAQLAPAEGAQNAGLKFQMRYSLPLFVYGEGLFGKERPLRTRTTSDEAHPKLSWQLVDVEGRSHLQVHNAGTGHARLSQVRLLDADQTAFEFSGGLLGYVLPGQRMRWPLPEDMTLQAVTLKARLGNKQTEVELPRE